MSKFVLHCLKRPKGTCIENLQPASSGIVIKETMESAMVRWNTNMWTLVLILSNTIVWINSGVSQSIQFGSAMLPP